MNDPVDRAYGVAPLDAGGVLDHGIYLYRDHFKTVAAIMGLFLFPALSVMDGAYLVLEERIGVPEPENLGVFAAFMLITFVYAIFLQVVVLPFASGALSYAMAAAYVGNPTTVKAAILHTLRRAPTLFAVALIGQLIVVMGSCLFVIPGIYAQVIFIPLYTLVVVENCGVRGAFSRCVTLMRGERMKGLLVLFALMIASSAAGMLDIFAGLPYMAFVWADLLQAFATGLPITTCTVFYFSARCRLEHVDLDLAVRGVERALPREAVVL